MERDAFSPEYVTARQAAQLTQFSYQTIMRAIWARKLRATQHAERGPWRIRLADLDAWMAGVRPTVRRSA